MTTEQTTPFAPGGTLRRLRRLLDLSQRELAVRAEVSASTIAAIESGKRHPSLAVMSQVLASVGVRLIAVREDGSVVTPMPTETVRDAAGRRLPVHLDPRYGELDWWGDRLAAYCPRPRPWFTFDRHRPRRDERRAWQGTEPDHRLASPTDDPDVRRQLHRMEQRLQAAARAGQPANVEYVEECRCEAWCERSCHPRCDCQCEPA